ncbi:27 kDa hemolymph protein-like [Anastrepha ludens]|uniref:27 kDa hemolymph protein-like n=1 Tax=Anastrepha ludens TaxID=28586 RepID=UPI0023B116B5|nr:27 kDa hemolymph protein-like [Anastrepha ludens]
MLLAHNLNICLRSVIIYLSMELLYVNANVNGDAKIHELITLYIPAELVLQNFTIPDAKHIFAHKCKKADIQDSVNATIDGATGHLVQCVTSKANLTEIDAVRLHVDLDTRESKKFCQQRLQSATFLRQFSMQLSPCLSVVEREQSALVVRVKTIFDYVCSDHGEVMTVFLAEQVPKCIERNKENPCAGSCKNMTLASQLSEHSSAEEAQNFAGLLDPVPPQCMHFQDFEKDARGYMEKSNETMPANVIEKMFQSVENAIKCQSEIDRMVRQNSTVKFSNISHSVEKSAIEVLVSVFMLSIIAQLLRC